MMPRERAGSISSTCPTTLLRRKWQWHLLSMLRQTLATDAIKQLVDVCFRKYPDGLVTNVQKGASPVAVSECGALCGEIRGEPADLGPAH